MKNIYKILLVVLFGLFISSCGDNKPNDEQQNKHEHQYSETWDFDEQYHWHKCMNTTSACDALIIDKTKHNFDDGTLMDYVSADGHAIYVYKCKDCKYEFNKSVPHVHNYSKDWTYNDKGHYHKCTSTIGRCDKPIDNIIPHNFDNGILQPSYGPNGEAIYLYTCLDCGYTKNVLKVHVHDYSKDWTYNDKGHYHKCTSTIGRCDKPIDNIIPHNFDNGILQPSYGPNGEAIYLYTCLDCGFTKETLNSHKHSYSTEWFFDENGHYHKCTSTIGRCDKPIDNIIPHNFDNGILQPSYGPNGEAIYLHTCLDCGFSKEVLKSHIHDYSKDFYFDENGHWHICNSSIGRCDKPIDNIIPHNFDNGILQPSYGPNGEAIYIHTCLDCGFTKKTLEAHVHNYTQAFDELNHFDKCTSNIGKCDAPILNKNAHNIRRKIHPIYGPNGESFYLFACFHCNFSKEVFGPHVHLYDDLKFDELNHWYECLYKDGNCPTTVPYPHRFDNGIVDPNDNTSYLYTCLDCGYVKHQKSHVHIYEEVWSSDESYHWHKCIAPGFCNKPIKDLHLHNLNEGVITQQPTPTSNGTKEYTCLDCGKTIYQVIDYLNKDTDFNSIIGEEITEQQYNANLLYSNYTVLDQYYISYAGKISSDDRYEYYDKNKLKIIFYRRGTTEETIKFFDKDGNILESQTYNDGRDRITESTSMTPINSIGYEMASRFSDHYLVHYNFNELTFNKNTKMYEYILSNNDNLHLKFYNGRLVYSEKYRGTILLSSRKYYDYNSTNFEVPNITPTHIHSYTPIYSHNFRCSGCRSQIKFDCKYVETKKIDSNSFIDYVEKTCIYCNGTRKEWCPLTLDMNYDEFFGNPTKGFGYMKNYSVQITDNNTNIKNYFKVNSLYNVSEVTYISSNGTEENYSSIDLHNGLSNIYSYNNKQLKLHQNNDPLFTEHSNKIEMMKNISLPFINPTNNYMDILKFDYSTGIYTIKDGKTFVGTNLHNGSNITYDYISIKYVQGVPIHVNIKYKNQGKSYDFTLKYYEIGSTKTNLPRHEGNCIYANKFINEIMHSRECIVNGYCPNKYAQLSHTYIYKEVNGVKIEKCFYCDDERGPVVI